MRATFTFAILLITSISAFQRAQLSSSRVSPVAVNQYVPDGFTAASYKKFKEDEKKKQAKLNLGGVGPRGFKSRSMQSFQEAMERGEAEHLLPVFNAKERVKKGELKVEEIPYMQRGGSWDNSDVKGAKKKPWSKSDKEYAGGGFLKEQSISIFGRGQGLDWTGTRGRTGPTEAATAKPSKVGLNYKPPNVNTMKGLKEKPPSTKKGEPAPKKSFWGLF